MEAKPHIIRVTDKELAELIHVVGSVDLVFGPSGVWLEHRDGEPVSEAIQHLGKMRGVTNQNMDGAGI